MAGDLAVELARLIRHGGPIPISRFMAEANGHYYASRDPFGAGGDFITAPEISQMFGELIGLWCAEVWTAIGRPGRFVLAELGPGRGTLMADALRAAGIVPGFRAAAAVHLVETSPLLRERQRAALADANPTWHATIDSLPGGPAIVIANEFFDALPIRQFVRGPAGWQERMVGIGGDGRFQFALAPHVLANALLPTSAASVAAEGSVVEVCPTAQEIIAAFARRVVSDDGAILVIDYGAAAAGDSLQAVRAHRHHAVLDAPGEADLTAHVDFAALATAAGTAGARAWGPLPQGLFLRRLGLDQRAAMLAAKASAAQAAAIEAAQQRLTGAAAMGTLFQALAITRPDAAPPPGFES
jgi:NADH dehydrogenase [ubiquinone] 1 alpha subcomplex assembly factor 7